jgi:hypothetical protein
LRSVKEIAHTRHDASIEAMIGFTFRHEAYSV